MDILSQPTSQRILRHHLILALIAWAVSSLHAFAADPPSSPTLLKVQIEGIRSNQGKLVIALFESKKTFTKKAIQSASLTIKDHSASWTTEPLSPGNYAIALYHDANENGKMDKNFFGIPREDYGFSRDAKPSFGPPRWEDAVFEVKSGSNFQPIVIQKK